MVSLKNELGKGKDFSRIKRKSVHSHRVTYRRMGQKTRSMETSDQFDFLGSIYSSTLVLLSTPHNWLGRMEKEGFLDQLLDQLIELGELIGRVSRERLSIDSLFSGRRGGEQVDYG